MTMADGAGVSLDVVTSSRLLHSRRVRFDWDCAGKSCERLGELF
jgi:hypothetical protein